MSVESCLCFCEIELSVFSGGNNFEQVINTALKLSGFKEVHRIYIGSNFCSQYFLHIEVRAMSDLIGYCKKCHIPVTLCLPIFTQKDLKSGKRRIAEYATMFDDGIDEVTVNDYGMCAYIGTVYPNVKVNVGRLLNKDTRDFRYSEYYNAPFTPSAVEDDRFFGTNINYVELDPTHSVITIPDIQSKIALYKPYCYATVGQICEFASIDLPMDKKFRPNCSCNANCSKVYTTYQKDKGQIYYKIGRTVYLKNEDVIIEGVQSYRCIYQPFDLVGKI